MTDLKPADDYTDPPPDTTTPFGLWLGGLFANTVQREYTTKDGEMRALTLGRLNIATGGPDDRTEDFEVPQGVILPAKPGERVLLNVTAFGWDYEMRYRYLGAHDPMQPQVMPTAGGGRRPMAGLFLIGAFNCIRREQRRDWQSRSPNAMRTVSYLKFSIPLLQADDHHPEVDITDVPNVPDLAHENVYLVPITGKPSKRGHAFALNPTFPIQKWNG